MIVILQVQPTMAKANQETQGNSLGKGEQGEYLLKPGFRGKKLSFNCNEDQVP